MALDNKILKDFFDKNKVSLISTSVKKLRVFDDPDYNRKNIDISPIKSEDKVESEPETNRRQLKLELETKQRHVSSSNLQSKDKLETEQKTPLETKWRQSEDDATCLTSYSSLTGLQRIITLFIYDQCKIARSSTTNQIAIEFLSIRCQTTKSSAKKTIQRLVAKDIITRAAYKDGRNGWSRYQLNNQIYQAISYEESTGGYIVNWRQMGDKVDTQPATQPATNLLSSSSLINKTTTITNEEKNELPEEWKEIDIESLEGLIRFHPGHVKQLFKHGLDLKPVQESIYHYAFDLTENNKAKDIKTDPISFFMGIMKRSGYYAAPENYESPQTRGRRLFLEQEAKKAEQLLAAEKATMNAYLEIWLNKLSRDEKTELVGSDEMTGNGILMQSDKLKKHYREVIWPAYYQKLLNGVE